MKMKKLLHFFLLALFIFSGCKKDKDDDLITPGDLYVTVTLNGYFLVEDANVYTIPATTQGKTDAFGTVLLKGIVPGSYEIFASVTNVGSGKQAVNIKSGELSEITINVIEGVHVGYAPVINVILPAMPAEFAEGEAITFSIDVEDSDSPLEEISVKFESDLDGLIHTGSPGINGNLSFTTQTLSRGLHQINIIAEDSDGYSSDKTLIVSTLSPKSVTLHEPVKDQGRVILNWSEYEADDFLKYEVYRSNENCTDQSKLLIGSITEKGTTTFTDSLPPMEYRICYHIRITNTDNNSRNSNAETVDMPSGHIFNFVAHDMLKHPNQPFIYLIDRGGQKLIKFNYEQLEVVSETSLQGDIGFCDIGDNGFGVEVYTPSNDGWIYIYSADDLSLVTSINTGLRVSSVVINGLGHVIAAVFPSPWWEQPVRTYSRATGINIDGNGDHDGDRLRMIPGKNEIISISTGVSPTDMEYFKLDEQGMIVIHQDDPYHGDYPLNHKIFRISDDGTYSITSNKGAVYLANSSMEYKGQLQHGALQFSDFAFSADGSVIYAATSNRNSIQIGYYPSLIRDDEILIKGYPVFIIRDNDKLIALSKSTEHSSKTGIELISLP